jgi:hypothetical protein
MICLQTGEPFFLFGAVQVRVRFFGEVDEVIPVLPTQARFVIAKERQLPRVLAHGFL